MAGLLDSLNFNGGLLDFLQSLQQPQNSFSGLPSDIAQYGGAPQPMQAMAQMPPRQQPPMQAPPMQQPAMQAAPQPAPMQAPQQPPQAGDSYMDRINSGGSLIGSMFGGNPARQAANQTAQYLIAKHGMDPALAQSIVSDPATLRSILPSIMGVGGQTDDIKEYQFAKKEDPSLTFASFMQKKKSVSGEYGMTPIWGVKDGKPAILQLGKSGSAVQAGMPEGFELSRDPIKVEGPTGTSILDPQTRQVIQFIPKDVAGAAKEKEIGEAQGKAIVSLPNAIATADNTLKTIKQLEEHPGKKSWGAFGWGAKLPDAPGGETIGFDQLLQQIKGQNFLVAYQSLKSAGAITDIEGTKAEMAQARLSRAQSEKDFDIAIKDLKDIVIKGKEKARQMAGQSPSAPQSNPNQDALKKKYNLD